MMMMMMLMMMMMMLMMMMMMLMMMMMMIYQIKTATSKVEQAQLLISLEKASLQIYLIVFIEKADPQLH